MKIALRIVAYLVAISGWLVIIAFVLATIALVAVGLYTKLLEIGWWQSAKNVCICFGVVFAIFGGLAIWIKACDYVGWGDD